jgi:hypothetical protein
MLAFLQRICSLFDSHQIEYMLSGSLALNVYTVPRMTRDIDIVISLKESEIQTFLELFPEDQFYFSLPAIKEAVQNYGMFNIIDFQSSYKLDLIVLKPDNYRQTEFQRRVRSEVLGFGVYLVCPEDLILSKLIWIQELMSDRQMDDLKHLLALKDLDWDYLIGWAQTLQLKTFGLINHA